MLQREIRVMRIIAGKLAGRRFGAPDGRGTRPTSDRVREALRPLRPLSDVDGDPDGPDEPWPGAALAAVLDEFNSPPPVTGRKRGWRPRELTGATPAPDED